MSDLVFLLVVVAFFAVAAGFVGACERIVGRAEPTAGAPSPTPAPAPALDADGRR
ncbi:MAG: hypothetical protein R2746_18580 [Acidimicrobiales bacterium]